MFPGDTVRLHCFCYDKRQPSVWLTMCCFNTMFSLHESVVQRWVLCGSGDVPTSSLRIETAYIYIYDQ